MQGVLAADIGGTKLAAAAFSNGVMRVRKQIPTNPEKGRGDVIRRLAQLLTSVAEASEIEPIALGVASPGPLSSTSGIVYKAPMLGWENVPLVQLLSKEMNIPVFLECDTNAAALGEYRFGAGRGCRNMVYVTVSTGVGAGIISEGKLLEGKHGAAGELGHLVLDPTGKACGCGHRGCLELYASGTAMDRAAKALHVSRGGIALEMSAAKAAELARAGDLEYRSIFEKAGEALGRGIGYLLQILDTDRIVLGGSAIGSLDLYRDSFLKVVQSTSYWGNHPEDWLFTAELQPDSGLYGAAALALDKINE